MSSSCATVFPAGWGRCLYLTAAVSRDIRGLTKDACGSKESTGHSPNDNDETKPDDDSRQRPTVHDHEIAVLNVELLVCYGASAGSIGSSAGRAP